MSISRKAEPLTIILFDWGRRKNQLEIIKSLRKQTVQPKIFVWNNNPEPFPREDVNWIIDSSVNYHTFPFQWLAHQADTEFVGKLDDDLIIINANLLEDLSLYMNSLSEKSPDSCKTIVGCHGVQLIHGKSYERSQHVNVPQNRDIKVDIVKGRALFLNPKGIVPFENCIHTDIQLSMTMGIPFQRRHIVPSWMKNKFKELPAGDCGYCKMPNHIKERNELTQKWITYYNQKGN